MNAFFNQPVEEQNAQYDAAEPMKKLKVCITGGAGFLGAHIARHCLNLGMEVHVIDNLSGGFEDNIPDGCIIYPHDILELQAIENVFKMERFNAVYHIAADARENLSNFTSRWCYQNNLIGSINIINACINTDVKTVVFTSSIATMAGGNPPYEETDPFMCIDSYGISKAAVELHLHNMLQMFGLNYIIFRPYNIFGPLQNIGDKYRNVVGIFMNQLMKGEKMTIFGDGEQRRSFSYIDDVAPHIAKSVLRPECLNQTFFIGGAQQYSVNELAYVVAAEFGVLPEEHTQYLAPRHEAKVAWANTDKARSFFGAPKTDLATGVHLMAEWAKVVGARRSQDFKDIEIRKNLPEGW